MRYAKVLDTVLLANLVLAVSAMLLFGAMFALLTGDAFALLFGPLLALAEAREGSAFGLWVVGSHALSLGWWAFRRIQAGRGVRLREAAR